MRRGSGLAELRRRKLLTQRELAQALGTSYQTVQRWEAGQSEPRPAAKRRLCAVLGVTPEVLLAALQAVGMNESQPPGAR